MKNKSSVVLGTWSWGIGAVGGDQVFGNHVGTKELKLVFDEAMAKGLNLWDSAVVYGMGASETVLSTFTKKPSQVQDAVRAMQVVLTANEVSMLEDTAENTGVDTRSSWENLVI